MIAPVNERMWAADVRQQAFNSMDRDTFLEYHQEEYGYYYSDNMSEAEKTDLYRLVKSSLEEESNAAQRKARGLWHAEESMDWIKNNVYNRPNDSYNANKVYEELVDYQADAWFTHMITDNEESESMTQMWDLAEEKLISETNDLRSVTYQLGKIGKEFAAAVAEEYSNIPDEVTDFLDLKDITEDTMRDVGMIYKMLIEAGWDKEEAKKKARTKGVLALFKNFAKTAAKNYVEGKVLN